jgi:adenylate kinase family enzyme
MNPFILLINGPQCAGKSTVAELLLNSYPNLFHITGDKIKWLISDYAQSKQKYSESDVINKMLYKLSESAIVEGFSLLIETNIGLMKSWIPKYKALADSNEFVYLELNIEAPYDVLKERFEKRAQSAKAQGSKISVTKVDDMKLRFDGYQKYKNSSVPTLDSYRMSSEEILNQIVEKLK